MGQLHSSLRRHGLALGLTVVSAVLVWGAALPAVQERAAARAERRSAQQRLELQARELRRAELWLDGLARGDAQLEARLNQEQLRSPDLRGPLILVSRPGPDETDWR